MSSPIDEELEELKFLGDFIRIKTGIENYRAEYVKVFTDLDEAPQVLDDIEIAARVRSYMSLRIVEIKQQLDSGVGVSSFISELDNRARKAYVPKKVNIPREDQTHLLPEQRIYLHVKERIQALGICAEEFFHSVEEAIDVASNQLIDQELFDGAIEAGLELQLALQTFKEDFPRLFSQVDLTLLSSIGNSNLGIDPR